MKSKKSAVTTKDCANAVASRVAETSLRAMLAVRQKRPIPQPEVNQPVDAVLALRWAGRYTRGSSGLDLIERSSALFLLQSRGGYLSRLRSNGEALVVDDRHAYGKRILPQADQVIFGDEVYKRIPLEKPLPVAAKWKGLIGEYGWDHDILYILERDGKLWALIEWFEFDPLEQVSDNVFKFPAYGLYDGEQLIFSCDAKGRAVKVEAANVVFHRRKVGPEKDAQQLHVKPLTPVTRLARQALYTQPPKEARAFRTTDLVELTTLDPTIRLDIRYATDNNFLGTVLYRHARAFMQRPAAESLVRAHRKLKDQGYELLIYDAYRPWYVTKIFWDATPDDKKIFVANPAEGFAVYVAEWWHFDYKDWREYPIGNIAFEKIAPNRPTH